jgi:hypothetical protein
MELPKALSRERVKHNSALKKFANSMHDNVRKSVLCGVVSPGQRTQNDERVISHKTLGQVGFKGCMNAGRFERLYECRYLRYCMNAGRFDRLYK